MHSERYKLGCFYDSLAEEGTPLELLFFFSYLLIQGCLRTSDKANLSSGSLRSSYFISSHPHHNDWSYPGDQVRSLWRNRTGYLQIDISDPSIGCFEVSKVEPTRIRTYLHDRPYPRMVDFRLRIRTSRPLVPRDPPSTCAPFLRPFLGASSRGYHRASCACHLGHAAEISASPGACLFYHVQQRQKMKTDE